MQDKSIAWGHIDCLFKGCLSITQIRSLLEGECQIAKCFFIVLLDLKSVQEPDCCKLIIILFVFEGAQIYDCADVLRVGFRRSLKHFLSIDTSILVPIDQTHIHHRVCVSGVLGQSDSAVLEGELEVLRICLLNTQTVVGQPDVGVVVAVVLGLHLRCLLVMHDRLVKVFHNECNPCNKFVHLWAVRAHFLTSFQKLHGL